MNTKNETEIKNIDTESSISNKTENEVVLSELEYLELKQKEIKLEYAYYESDNYQRKAKELNNLAQSRKDMFLWIAYLFASLVGLVFELSYFITTLTFGIDSLDVYDYVALGVIVILLAISTISIIKLVQLNKYNKACLLEVARYEALAQGNFSNMIADPEYERIAKRLEELKNQK